MLALAFLQLRLDAARTALTATAIAAVVAVILVLEGFSEGLIAQMRLAVLDRNADLIVTQAGISNMTAARSILPQFSRAQAEAVPGVATAHPITGIPLIYEQEGTRAPIFLLVYDTAGGAKRLAAGRAASEPREIVIDRSLAKRYGLELGDPLVVSDFEFHISGISDGAAAFFTSFGFARFDDLIDLYFESELAADITTFPLVSFLLIELEPDADSVSVARQIEQAVPSGDVYTPAALAEQDALLGRALFGPIMGLLINVSYVIGALVTGIIMFAEVNGRRRDFGVMKALGFRQGFLNLCVISQAVLLAAVGIPLGILLAAIIAQAIETALPLYLIEATEPATIARTAAACLGFTVLGAIAPVHMIRRLDPSMVFRC